MSYRTWSIYGTGVNTSKIAENISSAEGNGKRWEQDILHQFLRDIIAFNNKCNNVISDNYPELYNYICNADNDPAIFANLDGETITDVFDLGKSANNAYSIDTEPYQNDRGEEGTDALICDLLDERWATGKHININSACRDSFGDGQLYWYLEDVKPWVKPEFASRDDCEQTLRNCFEQYLTSIDIEDIDFTIGG